MKPIEILDKFVKEFDDTDSWYDTNDYWNEGDFHPPFDTDLDLLVKVANKILSIPCIDSSFPLSIFFSQFSLPLAEKGKKQLFDDVVDYVIKWNEFVRRNITKDVKAGVKNGSIKHEDDAREIAIKYLTPTITSYVVTVFISDLLPRTEKTVIQSNRYKHPYFKGDMVNTLYEDIWGRVWNKSVGVLKNNSELKIKYWETFKEYSIDGLGGSMWRSKRGKTFVCEYRTTIEESTMRRNNPETFVG